MSNFTTQSLEQLLADFISSKTRVKLLLKFFLNTRTTSYLRDLAKEFDESTNAVRIELNRLEQAGMLTSYNSGNKKLYKADQGYPLFDEIQDIVKKHLGIDQIIETVVHRLGNLEAAYLTGPFSAGIDAPIIDLILVGKLRVNYLAQLIGKAEPLVGRKIRYIHYSSDEWSDLKLQDFTHYPMLIWEKKKVIS